MNTPNPYRHSLFHFTDQPERLFGGKISSHRVLLDIFGNVSASVFLVAFFGASFALVMKEPALAGAGKMLLMSGSGWLILMGMAAILLPGKRRAYFHGLSYMMGNGALPLIPAAVFIRFAAPYPLLSFCVAVGAVLIAFGTMLHMHLLLSRRLDLGRVWTFAWSGLLFGTAAIWFLFLCDTDFSCLLN